MTSNFTQHFCRQNLFAKVAAKIVVLLALLFVLSCSDQGCIEADDFGEYESQTIEVTSNNSQDVCKYDLSKPLDSADYQGNTVRLCFSTGAKTVEDENRVSKSVAANAVPGGCMGFQEASFKNMCLNQCIQECLMKATATASSPQPNWASTSKKSSTVNNGVTIMPGAEIIVNAIGTVSLGNSLGYPDIYVKADDYLPDTRRQTWNSYVFDVRNNQSINFNFSGTWNSGADWTNGSSKSYGSSSLLSSSGTTQSDINIFNGARRLVAYVIPHPAGYDFDATQNDEKLGTKGVPILPETSLWSCTYASNTTTGIADATCSVGNYNTNGYPNVSNASVAATFPISGSAPTSGLGQYGGLIRWTNDGLQPSTYDPFSLYLPSSSCTVTSCTINTAQIKPEMGTLVGDAVNAQVVIPNPSSTSAFHVEFKNLSTNTSCNTNVKVWVKSGTESDPAVGNFLDNGGGSTGTTYAVVNSSWNGSPAIVLEPGQKLVIDRFGSSSVNCGKVTGVKFNRMHEIEIDQSGFASFSMLGGSSAACVLKGRIINPTGSFSNATFSSGGAVSGYSADFYETDDFYSATSSTSKDPIANLSVNSSGTWTAPIFVRKGQKLRFASSSWNTTWTPTAGYNVTCGVGMAMRIIPRPALLCRGVANDTINNPACIPDYDSSSGSPVLIGCKASAPACSSTTTDSNGNTVASTPASFCPIINCQKAVTCTNNTGQAPNYAKSGCSATGTIVTSCAVGDTACQSTLCTYNASGSPAITSSTCNSCSALNATYANYSAKINLPSADQCYDLENYTGKVANISATTGMSDADLANPATAKGLVKLDSFNGSYGNFANFANLNNNNSIATFTLKDPLVFTNNGRLRFMLLDGAALNNSTIGTVNYTGTATSYANNSASGGSYAGNNGVLLKSSGMLTFSNGQWMEVKLCKETSDTSIECRGPSLSSTGTTAGDLRTPVSRIDEQPRIIDITPPTTTLGALSPSLTGAYKFDASGNLVRISGTVTSNDCSSTLPNSYFYCHKFDYFTDDEFKAKNKNDQSAITADIQKIRLSFKILDPEIASCQISNPSNNYLTPSNTAAFDGVVMTNSYYRSDISGNTSQVCGANQIPGGNSGDCQKQYYCAGKYANNSGSYYVKVKVKNPAPSTVSSLIGGVIQPIIRVMDGDGSLRDCSTSGGLLSSSYDGIKTVNPIYDPNVSANVNAVCTSGETNCQKQYYCKISNSVGQAERVYRALISDPRYKAILNMCITVMFTFYGVGYLMGVIEISHSDLISRLVKISLIYLFVGETGWDWFNMIVVRFFKNGTDYLAFTMASSFDDSPQIGQALASGDFYDKSVLFSSVDQVFNMFFSPAVQKKVSALLFASIFGWLYLLIIYWGFSQYLYAIANAVLLYLTAQVFISILFTLGPLFFIFTLFSQTKGMFDKWLTQLIGFSLQQIFLLTTLAFFNMLMYEVIKMSLGYKICWAEVWSINIIVHISLMSFWTIASLPPRTNAQSSVGNIGNPDGIPSLFSILFIYVIASLMEEFISFMTNVAATISGGLSASKMGEGLKSVMDEGIKQAKGQIDNAWNASGAQELVNRIDDKLFDSGKNADDRRKKEKAENATNQGHKSALEKAGNKAEKDYLSKGENVAKLAGMSKEEQKAHLKGVRDEAMNKEGKKRGLNEEGVKNIKKFEGKYVGENVGMMALSQANKAIRGSNSIDSKAASKSSAISESTMKSALKNANSEDRKKIADGVKNGSLEVKRSNVGKAVDAGKKASKAASDAYKGAKGAASAGATKAQEMAKGASEMAQNAAETVQSLGTEEGRQAAMDNISQGLQSAAESVQNTAAAVGESVQAATDAVGSLGTAEGRQAAAEGLAKGVSAAAGAVKNAGSQMAKGAASLNEAMKSEDTKGYEEARDQLVEEGEIDQMAAGTEWARDDKQKDAIKERQALNKAAKSTASGANKGNDSGVIANMEKELDYLKEVEGISEDAPLSEQISKRAASEAKRFAPNSDSSTKSAAASGQKSLRDKVGKDLSEAKNSLETFEKQLDLSQKSLDNTNQEIANNPEAQAIQAAKDKVENSTGDEQKAAKSDLAALEKNKSPQLKKLENDKDVFTKSIKQNDAAVKMFKPKVDKLQKTANAMDKAAAIKNKAQNAVTPQKDEAKKDEAPAANETTQRTENAAPELDGENALNVDPDNNDSVGANASTPENGGNNNAEDAETKSPAQEKLDKIAESAQGQKAEAQQEKTQRLIDNDNKAKERAASTANTPKAKLNLAVSNAAAAIKDQLSATIGDMRSDKKGKAAEQELSKVENLRGDTAAKADAMLSNAESVINNPDANTNSKEYMDAVKTKEEFDNINSTSDMENFVKGGEEKADNIAQEFDDLKRPEDFEKFVAKHEQSVEEKVDHDDDTKSKK